MYGGFLMFYYNIGNIHICMYMYLYIGTYALLIWDALLLLFVLPPPCFLPFYPIKQSQKALQLLFSHIPDNKRKEWPYCSHQPHVILVHGMRSMYVNKNAGGLSVACYYSELNTESTQCFCLIQKWDWIDMDFGLHAKM